MKKYLLFAVCCTLMLACGGKSGSQAGNSAESEQVEEGNVVITDNIPTSGDAELDKKELETRSQLEPVMRAFHRVELTRDKRTCAYEIRRIIEHRRKLLKKRLGKDDSPVMKAYCEKESKRLDDYYKEAIVYIPKY